MSPPAAGADTFREARLFVEIDTEEPVPALTDGLLPVLDRFDAVTSPPDEIVPHIGGTVAVPVVSALLECHTPSTHERPISTALGAGKAVYLREP
jgi:hypothetical protein